MKKALAAVDAMNKTSLRGQAIKRRNALAEIERVSMSAVIAGRAGEIILSLLPDCVAVYRAIGSECDPAALVDKMSAAGVEIALPAIVDKTTIVFRRYAPGDTLVPGGFGTSVPAPHAPALAPGIIVLPVVAFDRKGARLGYGRGYYDRAIAAQRSAGYAPKLLGIAFSVQEVEGIPGEKHDARLDWIVTEKETIALPDGVVRG